MTKGKPTQRTRTAYHEAGHAVISRVLRISVELVTIHTNGRTLGAVAYKAANRYPLGAAIQTEMEWQERERPNENLSYPRAIAPRNSVLHAHIIATLAGSIAESEFFGGTTTGNSSDKYQIREMLSSLYACDRIKRRKRLRRATRHLVVRRHRDRIARVADHLLASNTLDSQQLDQVLSGRRNAA